jgi:hypothetical protein
VKRSLDHHHADVRCTNGHSGELMEPAGFYALKEAGAPFTILAFRCGRCHRELFVTEQVPYGHPSAAMLQEIDETP